METIIYKEKETANFGGVNIGYELVQVGNHLRVRVLARNYGDNIDAILEDKAVTSEAEGYSVLLSVHRCIWQYEILRSALADYKAEA